MAHSLVSPFMGEFMGTMVLILLGNGVVAGVLLKHSKAEGAGWLTIATAWGIAVFAGVFTSTAWGSPDAHLNPAITVAAAIVRKIDFFIDYRHLRTASQWLSSAQLSAGNWVA